MQEKKEPAKITWVGALWLVVLAVAISAFLGWEFGKGSGYETGYETGKAEIQAKLQDIRETSYDQGYDDGYAARDLEEHYTIDWDKAEASAKEKDQQQYDAMSETVYITNTGEKYHRYGCQYLRKSQIAISLDDAISRGYTACSRCW